MWASNPLYNTHRKRVVMLKPQRTAKSPPAIGCDLFSLNRFQSSAGVQEAKVAGESGERREREQKGVSLVLLRGSRCLCLH